MNQGYSLKVRSLASTWFSITFFILLGLYLGYIEFIQDSKVERTVTNLLENPIETSTLNNVISLRFKNRIGTFSVKKEDDKWLLQEPRVIPAKTDTLNKILKALKNIKVHTIHEFEPINLQSFSLDKPTIEIDLYTKLNEKYRVKIGLLNPIDNTSYLTVSGLNRIYQTNLFKGGLEKMELSDFIDSQVFSFDVSQVKRFQLYQGKTTQAFNDLSYISENWKAKKYNTISTSNVDKKLSQILNIKTHMIIDKKDEELETFIQNYLDNPLYRLVVTTKDKKVYRYTVTSLIRAIPELKIGKHQYFIVSASNRPYPYILNKKYLEEFLIRYSDLKP